MQLSYPITAYRACVERAFCELLIGHQYATELPQLDRFTKFLTRIKEAEFDFGDPLPGLTTTDLCKTGLPINWVFAQFNRGPLSIIEEDEFRVEIIRCFTDDTRRCFEQDDFGFGRTELNFWMVGNNGSAIEAAETLFYMRLYKLKTIDFLYLGYPWHALIDHEMLQSFEPLGMNEYGTGFTIQWRVVLYVPILRREIEGFTVQEICSEIYDGLDLHCPRQFPIPFMSEEEFLQSQEAGATRTIITSAEDDGHVNISQVDGPCPDGTEEIDSGG
jgi:hypothetical protein